MPVFRRDRVGTIIMQGPPQEVIEAAATDAAAVAVTTEIAGRDLVEMGRQIVAGKNLIDPDQLIPGQRLNGSGGLTGSTTYVTTGHIRVQAGQAYTFSSSYGTFGARYINFYDAAGALVSHQDLGSAQPVSTQTATVHGTVRASYRDVAIGTAQIEKGENATGYEPYHLRMPDVRLDGMNVVDGTIDASKLAVGAVSPERTTFFGTGKNLFDPDAAVADVYVDHINGNLIAFAGYVTSGLIPVTAGQAYTANVARKWAFYDTSGVYVSGHDLSQPGSPYTRTAPADGFMRVSANTTAPPNLGPSGIQVERGSVATAFEPFTQTIPTLGFTAAQREALSGDGRGKPLVVTKAGEGVSIRHDLDGAGSLVTTTSRSGSANGAFNLIATTLNDVTIHAHNDDITPIRTFATVGANHGYTTISRYTDASHGKSSADLGSVYTDGTRQYTLLRIDGNDLTFGHPYTVTDGVTTGGTTPPAATLTHVSGGTNTSTVPITSPVAGAQLYPSINQVAVRYELDGREISIDG